MTTTGQRIHVYPTEAMTLCARDATHPSVESMVHKNGAEKPCPDCAHFQKLGIAPKNADLFYVLSLNHTKRREGLITVWAPRFCDYVYRLEWSGRYTAEDLVKERLHDGEKTLAVPCEALEAVAITAAEASEKGCRGIDAPDQHHPGTDRVVPWSRLRELRATFGEESKRRAAYKRGIRVGRREGDKPKSRNPYTDQIQWLAWTRGVWDGAKQAQQGLVHL
jgi:hypothetical protein